MLYKAHVAAVATGKSTKAKRMSNANSNIDFKYDLIKV